MRACDYEGSSYLFMINSNKELLIYKKFFCSSGNNPHSLFGASEIGFLYQRISLPLTLVNKFKYNPALTFIQIGCGVFRISNLAFYKGSIVELPEETASCFEMDGEIWSIQNDGRIKMLKASGRVMSHYYLCNTIACEIISDVLGLESRSE